VTTIAAVSGDGWSVLGADSGIVYGERIIHGLTDKASNNNGIVIAGAGDGHPTQVITNTLKITPPSRNVTGWLSKTLIPAIKQCLYENRVTIEKETDLDLLVMVKASVFYVDSSLCWFQDRRGVHTIGSGGDLALGALVVSNPSTPEQAVKAIRKAITIASQYDPNTKTPIQIIQQTA
jgi:ATP-dependent protease HslVU (ClpYQ) peptidase subunit